MRYNRVCTHVREGKIVIDHFADVSKMMTPEKESGCRKEPTTAFFVFLTLVDFARTEKQPICRNLEILHKWDDPTDFKISTVHVASLCVKMSAVYFVCFAEPGKTAW